MQRGCTVADTRYTDKERLAKLESCRDTDKAQLADHEQRLRRIERVTFGVIAAAALLGWIITQANSLTKFFS
jgi:hypothetical protein